jgi:hypothetical protein
MPTDEQQSIELLQAEIATLEHEIDSIYREAVRHDQELVALQDSTNALDYGPSEHRFLSTRTAYIHGYYYHLRQFWRNVALLGEIQGSSADHHRPPRELPAHTRLAFTMGEQIPMLDTYFPTRYPPQFEVVFTAEQVAAFGDSKAAERTVSAYYSRTMGYIESAPDPLRGTITRHVRARMRVGICGSMAPVMKPCVSTSARRPRRSVSGRSAPKPP